MYAVKSTRNFILKTAPVVHHFMVMDQYTGEHYDVLAVDAFDAREIVRENTGINRGRLYVKDHNGNHVPAVMTKI